MVLFLRDWGTSLVAGLVMPATLAVTFIALRLLGESFNLMTLGGLAAAVGLVIDDAIVVVENIVLHRDAGQEPREAIRSAIAEIRVPLIGSTITPIVVFLPLIAITGVTGTFFRALAITVGVALLTSLGLALTWTPTLSHYFLGSAHATTNAESANAERARRTSHGEAGVPPWLMQRYERTLAAGDRAAGGARRRQPARDGRGLRLLPAARHRSAAGDGRGRLHPRLHHAGRDRRWRRPTGC